MQNTVFGVRHTNWYGALQIEKQELLRLFAQIGANSLHDKVRDMTGLIQQTIPNIRKHLRDCNFFFISKVRMFTTFNWITIVTKVP